MRNLFLYVLVLWACSVVNAKEYHVKPTGNDAAVGSFQYPLRTINRAAQLALPGDTITVHQGVYREWIDPLNGGESDAKRILYRAAEGEKVEIKGSELIKDWKRDKKNKQVWKVVLPNSLFGNYNPFNDLLYGDWLKISHPYHTGDVFVNDVSLYETYTLGKVFSPDTLKTLRDPHGSTKVWYAEVDGENTTIYANFGDLDPNKELVEISVRPTCFYPTREGLNFITIRGFHISQAATQWAAPTAEQIGMIATHWCKGWIIENNIIKNSRANGITLGKERSSGHNLARTDSRLDGTLHYIEVIFRTLQKGWDKDFVGSHIVRNNIISDCEQTGICGSMGGAFSEIYGNHIYNILVKQQHGGAEMAGIKLHGAIDTYIHHNRIHKSGAWGIWLDWMAQGARISSNLLYDNLSEDIFLEVDHGPYIVDNNISLSPRAVREYSDGGAYLHNIFCGEIVRVDDKRYTPYHLNHSTQIKGFRTITEGDHRFYNNIFIGGKNPKKQYGLIMFDKSKWPITAADNLFCNGAKPMTKKEQGWTVDSANPNLRLEEIEGKVYLVSDVSLSELADFKGKRVDSDRLGLTKLSNLPFENPDGTSFILDKDYFGGLRPSSPTIGPFESSSSARIVVWSQENMPDLR